MIVWHRKWTSKGSKKQMRRAHLIDSVLAKGIGLVLACASAFVPMTAMAAAAKQPTAWMGATVGYGGYYQTDNWVPVTLTIHHVGPEKSADLVVRVDQSFTAGRRASGELRWHISLPTNGWIKRQIEVPGGVMSSGTTVSLIANGHTLYNTSLTGNAVSHVALVAVLSTSTQETQFLAGSSTNSNPVLPVAVDPAWLPASVNVLDGLTSVVTSVPTLATLSSAQQNALAAWVKLGGLLIVTGTGQAPSAWASELPLTTGYDTQTSGQSLADFAGSTSPPQTVSVDVSRVAPTARLWAGTNQVPLLASEKLGRGQIWQTSFSPMDPEFLGWTGNPQMWTTLFKYGSNHVTSALPSTFSASGALSLTSVGDSLAPLRVPSLTKFAVVFALYILVIGPLAFFLLRRFRRATWAWLLLPVISALTTVGIYTFGGTERPNGLLMDGVGVLDLTGDGQAESYAVQAFMSPYSGGLDFQMPNGTLAMPLSVRDNPPVADAVVNNGSTTQLAFRNVSRWHVRYVYATGLDTASGELVANLSSAYGLLFGTVRNQTPYTLDNVAIVWQNHIISLGVMKPGQMQTISQNAQASTNAWISDYGIYNRSLTHGIGRALGAYLSQFASNVTSSPDTGSAPEAMIIATTDARTPQLPRPAEPQDIASDKTLVLVREYAPVSPFIGGVMP